jgi:hypothetical protein
VSPEEFFALPVAAQVRILFDCIDEDTMRNLRAMEKPKLPLPPRYDQVIFRSGGVMYASETDLEGLRFWHKKWTDGAAEGGKYAESDRKRADNLARWITWRSFYPDATWSGERDRSAVVAKPPSAKPTVYPRSGGNRPPPPPEEDLTDSDGDIPF